MKKVLLLAICLTAWSGIRAQSPIQLPQPEISKLSMSVGDALKTRRSYREYQKGKAVDLQTLSTILWAACGISDPASGKITAPSAVNMQDIKVYVCSQQGVCLYDPKANTLVPVLNENLLDALATSHCWSATKAPGEGRTSAMVTWTQAMCRRTSTWHAPPWACARWQEP